MKIDDTEIVAAIAKNPEKGFRMLMSRFKEPIYWHIRRIVILHADAQDATQETFIRIYKSISSLRSKDSLSAWVYRIATNEAIRLMQLKTPDTSPVDESELANICADEYFDYSDLEAVRLQNAINSLPPRQKLAFTLRYYDDLDYTEIAKVMDSTASNAKMSYHLAKNKIIDFMNSND